MKHEEENLHIACVQWFSWQYPKLHRLLHHSPNGGLRNIREAARFKRMGTQPGFPDLILLYPSGGHASLCIELKSDKGRQTDSQKEWQELVERHGSRYIVCRSFDEFRDHVNGYLKNSLHL